MRPPILRRVKPAVRSLRPLRIACSGAAFGLCVAAFYDARALSSSFAVPRGDTLAVPPSELVFYAWYALYGSLAAAELAYRVLAPKTVVSSTGPIYLTEIVPLLALAVADACLRLGRVFAGARVRPSALVLSASIAGACMFLPLQGEALYRGGQTRRVVYDRLAASGADTALVFTNTLAGSGPATTWAYYPDNPSPQLNDRWLFARVPATGDAPARMLEFWRRRFPERRAFLFVVNREGDARFDELRAP